MTALALTDPPFQAQFARLAVAICDIYLNLVATGHLSETDQFFPTIPLSLMPFARHLAVTGDSRWVVVLAAVSLKNE